MKEGGGTCREKSSLIVRILRNRKFIVCIDRQRNEKQKENSRKKKTFNNVAAASALMRYSPKDLPAYVLTALVQ